jgi:hypothetical protein
MAAFGTTYLGGEWRALKLSIGGELCDLTISEIAVIPPSEFVFLLNNFSVNVPFYRA